MSKERTLKWKVSKPAEADVHGFTARVVLPITSAREMAVYCQTQGITSNDFVSLAVQDVLRNDKAFRQHIKNHPELLSAVELGKPGKKAEVEKEKEE